MVLRGNPDSWALLLPGLLNKRNKIGDVITSLLVVLKSSCIWGFFLKALTNQEVTLWEGEVWGAICSLEPSGLADWLKQPSSCPWADPLTHRGLTPKKPQLTP